MAKQDFTALIGKAKENQIKTPAQKVVPVKEKKNEVLFSLHIPADKLKALKLLSAEQNISLKSLINSAIDEKYFNAKK
ncbi:hypothetical protein NAL32_21015 [Chryseobacterium sp. Ch-15]|uniref:Uncharacterized protein n=1 Tax=Chryseobacterium muglaense TaxID=2893752 RepID=A0A9Q3YVQ7_9FLAO|nr:hypothetical protein [Chryseobacterium muglaense]MBD3906411.1 hypothetical protein [Chryseobacterium muglaense]MCC9037102.1 hypothetical protein [Chryseobacterium muglaense]MCM2556873.1 hypothetical protein [Chryseobacterium muglaense]